MSPIRHSGSTPDAPPCVHDYRAFRTVQAALQTATAALVSSHELVSCGNGGGALCCGWVNIRGHMINNSVCTLIYFMSMCAPSSSRVFFREEALCFPAEFRFLKCFFGSS